MGSGLQLGLEDGVVGAGGRRLLVACERVRYCSLKTAGSLASGEEGRVREQAEAGGGGEADM